MAKCFIVKAYSAFMRACNLYPFGIAALNFFLRAANAVKAACFPCGSVLLFAIQVVNVSVSGQLNY